MQAQEYGKFPKMPVEGETWIQETAKDVELALITRTSTVKDSSSFLHVEKMDSDVANSKYQSLFFILCQPQHRAQEGGDRSHSADGHAK